jgi:glycosyltransferase involved in cell wall biosynthesis
MVQLSIIIRTKNEEDFIGKTLDGIFHQKGDYPFEVIIIDSGSTDRTLEIAGRYKVKILNISQEKFTYGYSLNYGIGKSAGEIICLLSAHCIPADEQWLSEMIKPITDGTAHATYGRQIPVKGVNPFEEVSLNKHFPETDIKDGRVPFSNANCAFFRKMWEELHFDETLTSWEDYLWYWLQKKKFTFQYCPKATVYHTHPFSIRAIVKRTYNDGKAFGILKDKYGVDVLNDTCPNIIAKTKVIVKDLINHVTFLNENGYRKYILLIPVVRLYAYFAYLKGYISAR